MKKLTHQGFLAIRASIILLVCLFWVGDAQAGFERRDQGARPIGMGGAFVAIADDAWAIVFNPAGLTQLQGDEIAAFYSPQPFGMAELSLASFALVHPTSYGEVGLSVNRFGFDLYREVTGILSYASSYRDIFSFGINLTYNSLAVKNYGSASAIGIDIGILATVTRELRWGFFAANINAPSIGQAKEKLPQVYVSGLSFRPAEGLMFGLDVIKDIKYPALLRGGLEYKLVDPLSLRVGVGNNPTKFSSGLGVQYSFVHFDYAMTTHPDLGLSHQFSVAVDLNEVE
jgi:hypothetical protein